MHPFLVNVLIRYLGRGGIDGLLCASAGGRAPIGKSLKIPMQPLLNISSLSPPTSIILTRLEGTSFPSCSTLTTTTYSSAWHAHDVLHNILQNIYNNCGSFELVVINARQSLTLEWGVYSSNFRELVIVGREGLSFTHRRFSVLGSNYRPDHVRHRRTDRHDQNTHDDCAYVHNTGCGRRHVHLRRDGASTMEILCVPPSFSIVNMISIIW